MSETSDTTVDVVALVGSLRRASINRRLVSEVADNPPAGVRLSVIDGLDKLPFYNEDIDPDVTDDAPALDPAVVELRARVGAADAVLVATPEYNGSTPAALKNAIDWLSRPYGTGAIKDKPVGVISAALGRFGGSWSREDTRKSVGVAGGQVVEEVDFGLQTSDLEGERLPDTVIAGVVGALEVLTARVPARV